MIFYYNLNKKLKHIFINLFFHKYLLIVHIMTSSIRINMRSLFNENRIKNENINLKIDEKLTEEAKDLNVSIPIDNINICFVGGVSTGKSTILNAIFCEELTQCKIKRTTMVPTIYIENESNPFNITPSEEIFKLISEKNQEIIKKTENGEKISKNEYSELAFNVGKLDINILDDAYVNVYDIPGLNDARTKDIYYNYLEETFIKFNLVIFIVDIHSGLNTSDEIDIVNFITTNTKYQLEQNGKKIYTLVVINKADDMQIDEDSEEPDKLILTGELNEMYEQVEKTILTEFERKNIDENLIGILPLCAIDSYLYRMVKKHGKDFKLTPEQILKIGINENGKKFSTLKPATQEKKVYDILQDKDFIDTMIKLSGFSCLENMLHKFLNENDNGKTIRINNLLFDLSKLQNIIDLMNESSIILTLNEYDVIICKYLQIYENIKRIDYEQYYILIIEFVDKIRNVLENKVKNYLSAEHLLQEYDNFIDNIMLKYFNEFYDATDYPEFIKSQITYMIHQSFENEKIITIKDILSKFRIIKKINMFNKKHIQATIDISIIGRSNDYKYAIEFTNENNLSDESELISLLDEFISQGINITKFLRFIIIYKIKYFNDVEMGDIDDLYTKKILYQSYNEIHVFNYISQLLYGKEVSEISFIIGLDDIETISNEFNLDLYYLDLVKNITNKEKNQKTTISL